MEHLLPRHMQIIFDIVSRSAIIRKFAPDILFFKNMYVFAYPVVSILTSKLALKGSSSNVRLSSLVP